MKLFFFLSLLIVSCAQYPPTSLPAENGIPFSVLQACRKVNGKEYDQIATEINNYPKSNLLRHKSAEAWVPFLVSIGYPDSIEQLVRYAENPVVE